METQPGKLDAQPPRFLEAMVERLTPETFQHVVGDLAERYVGPGHYLKDAAEVLPSVILRQVQQAFVQIGRSAHPMSQHASRRAVTMNLLWMMAGVGLLLSAVDGMAASSPGGDFILGLCLVLAFTLGYRPWLTAVLGGAWLGRSLVWNRNRAVFELTRRRDGFAGAAPRAFSREPWNRASRYIVFLILAFPIAFAGLEGGFGSGRMASFPFGVHLGALFVLVVLWTPIRHANLRAARALDQEIEVLETRA